MQNQELSLQDSSEDNEKVLSRENLENQENFTVIVDGREEVLSYENIINQLVQIVCKKATTHQFYC